MFTKCFFSAPKVFFVCEMGAFFAKNVLFFPWKGAFFKVLFFCQSPLRSLILQGPYSEIDNLSIDNCN